MNEDALSGTSKRVMSHADQEARLRKHYFIGTEHLLVGLLLEATSATFQVLSSHGITLEKVRAAVDDVSPTGRETPTWQTIPYAPHLSIALKHAQDSAQQFNHEHMCPSDLLFGIMEVEQARGYIVLKRFVTDFVALRQEILVALEAKNAAKQSS